MRVDDLIKSLAEVFTLPIVVWPGFEDEDAVPSWMIERVRVERMIQHMKAVQGDWGALEEATDVEALIYLYTASLAQPLDEGWRRIYFHLARKYLGDRVSGDPALSFLEECRALDEREARMLRELKRWIKGVQRRVGGDGARGLRQASLDELIADG